jgi:two-component system KDP operon response regulator KdpE
MFMTPPDRETPRPLVLVIDDEEAMRRLLEISLESNGYQVRTASEGQPGLVEAATRKPDFVVLDLGLPDMEGLEVLRRIREWSRVPVIILSVRGEEQQKIAALDAGADDYLTKPFSVPELLARLRVAARHAGTGPEEPVFRSGGLEVDLATRRVTRNGEELRFTATEYALLACLVRQAGRVLTHRQILKEVWGPSAAGQTHYLRVYVRHLREKIEAEPSRPTLLVTEPGVGYRLVIID